MKKSAVFLLASLLLLTSLFSCKKEPEGPAADGGESLTGVHYVNSGNLAADDVYVFAKYAALSGTTEDGGIGKYNLKTGSVTHLCVDETCTHDSDSDCKARSQNLIGVEDRTLYYSRSIPTEPGPDGKRKTEFCICSYHAETGEARTLLRIPSEQFEGTGSPSLDDGKLWYLQRVPKNDHPASEKDYVLSLCRTDVKSGKTEVLLDAETDEYLKQNALFLLAADHWAYFLFDGTGYVKINPDTGEKKVFVEPGGSLIGGMNPAVIGNHFYAILFANPENTGIGGIPARINTDTGEITRLSDDDCAHWITVTDQFIYYNLNDPENKGIDRRNEIVSMRLDGTERRTVAVIENNMFVDAIANRGKLLLYDIRYKITVVDVQAGVCSSPME